MENLSVRLARRLSILWARVERQLKSPRGQELPVGIPRRLAAMDSRLRSYPAAAASERANREKNKYINTIVEAAVRSFLLPTHVFSDTTRTIVIINNSCMNLNTIWLGPVDDFLRRRLLGSMNEINSGRWTEIEKHRSN